MDNRDIPYRNSVVLCGRVAAEPAERVLPSGDTVASVRVIVRRSERARRRTRITVDAFECVAWTAELQETLSGLQVDDVVDLQGELRRRFRRVDGVPVSRVEVELLFCRMLECAS